MASIENTATPSMATTQSKWPFLGLSLSLLIYMVWRAAAAMQWSFIPPLPLTELEYLVLTASFATLLFVQNSEKLRIKTGQSLEYSASVVCAFDLFFGSLLMLWVRPLLIGLPDISLSFDLAILLFTALSFAPVQTNSKRQFKLPLIIISLILFGTPFGWGIFAVVSHQPMQAFLVNVGVSLWSEVQLGSGIVLLLFWIRLQLSNQTKKLTSFILADSVIRQAKQVRVLHCTPAVGYTSSQILGFAAALLQNSTNSYALALNQEYALFKTALPKVINRRTLHGSGVAGTIDTWIFEFGDVVYARKRKIELPLDQIGKKTTLYVFQSKRWIGSISFEEKLSAELVRELDFMQANSIPLEISVSTKTKDVPATVALHPYLSLSSITSKPASKMTLSTFILTQNNAVQARTMSLALKVLSLGFGIVYLPFATQIPYLFWKIPFSSNIVSSACLAGLILILLVSLKIQQNTVNENS